jgi:transcriptional regulator with PAS, ATPase and Fis domain
MSGLQDAEMQMKAIAERKLPLTSLVRAICEAADLTPDVLHEVMLKLSLIVEAAIPSYGLSTWTLEMGKPPRVKWAEGLNEQELDDGKRLVVATIAAKDAVIKVGDVAICLVLVAPGFNREGSVMYARCVRPLTEAQSNDLRAVVGLAQLARAHMHSRADHVLSAQDQPQIAITASTLPAVVYTSRVMSELARAVDRIKDSDSTVLITGESGTGKELIARAIHRLGRRSDREFIPFNCSAAPAELVESLLFGHRKGTFTGALSDNQGLIRAAENGTLFLDEIGDLPLTLQPKLLRFLQEGEVHTLGDTAPRQVNVRVIAATHKDLEQLVRQNLFREDLYYRIASLQLRVPPLRERPDDTAALISHFLSYYARRNDRPVAGITWEAIRALQEYAWPGNVRELAAEIERLVLYADENSYISVEHISPRILPESSLLRTSENGSARKLDELLEDYERQLITETLKRNDCNVARTSEALGLGSRQTLYKKLKRLAIDISEFLQEDTEPGLQLRAERH